MPFESIRLITFDCYGTLIDWENGMLIALRPLFSRDGRKVPDPQLLELYGEIETELAAGRYLPYRPGAAREDPRTGPPYGARNFRQRGPASARRLPRSEPL